MRIANNRVEARRLNDRLMPTVIIRVLSAKGGQIFDQFYHTERHTASQ